MHPVLLKLFNLQHLDLNKGLHLDLHLDMHPVLLFRVKVLKLVNLQHQHLQVLNKWSVMVHRKLKPDQEDAELDGEEGEKKGKKVKVFHIVDPFIIFSNPRGQRRRSSRSPTWMNGREVTMVLTQMRRRCQMVKIKF